MQRHCTELTERLLNSLDKEYNVVDMGGVVDVITILEKTTITKEVLEITRLGKHINELRRKTSNNALAKRAKELVRRWRETCLPSAQSTPQPTPADTAPPALNGAKPHSPALRGFKPNSPVLKGLKPESPMLKDATPLRVISPALSMHSDRSRSPNALGIKQSITATSNHRLRVTENALLSESQNYSTEAVPRTHSSNKRLRKDEGKDQQQQQQQQQQHRHRHQHQQQQQREVATSIDNECPAKRQRLNGENISGNLNSQVPSPTYKERIPDYYVESSEPDGAEPKKRGRKKGSKSAHKQPLLEDRVKEKLASISRNPKLKTTQELLADLQARGSGSTVGPLAPSQTTSVAEPPTTEVILRGSAASEQHPAKNLRAASSTTSATTTTTRTTTSGALATPRNSSSNKNNNNNSCTRFADNCLDPPAKRRQQGTDDGRTSLAETKSSEPRELTVEEILAKLPPLDHASIVWSEDETEPETEEAAYEPRLVTEVDLERLHGRCAEGLNGNFQPKLSSLTTGEADLDDEKENESKRRTSRDELVPRTTSLNGVDDDAYSQNEQEFREWHQMLARPSYDGQILHILPYVIID